MNMRRLVLFMVLTLALVSIAWSAAVVDSTATGGGNLGGPINEKDLLILAIPALVWVLKKTVVPTGPDGKVVGKWKKLTATLPVVLAVVYTWYRGGGVGLTSTAAGVILGATILGGRNWANKIRGK